MSLSSSAATFRPQQREQSQPRSDSVPPKNKLSGAAMSFVPKRQKAEKATSPAPKPANVLMFGMIPAIIPENSASGFQTPIRKNSRVSMPSPGTLGAPNTVRSASSVSITRSTSNTPQLYDTLQVRSFSEPPTAQNDVVGKSQIGLFQLQAFQGRKLLVSGHLKADGDPVVTVESERHIFRAPLQSWAWTPYSSQSDKRAGRAGRTAIEEYNAVGGILERLTAMVYQEDGIWKISLARKLPG